MSKTDVLKIIAKNAAIAATDSISTATMTSDGAYAISNLVSAGLKSWSEIKDFTKQSNDALYSLQVETFLNTADLNKEQAEKFLSENKDNLRLGMETLKILEKTHLEKQAELMGIAFKSYVKKEIQKKELDEYNHIIEQLTRYTLRFIESDAKQYLENIKGLDPTNMFYKMHLNHAFMYKQNERIPELITLGFMEEVVENAPISQYEIEKLGRQNRELKLKQHKHFKRTEKYRNFMVKIYFRA